MLLEKDNEENEQDGLSEKAESMYIYITVCPNARCAGLSAALNNTTTASDCVSLYDHLVVSSPFLAVVNGLKRIAVVQAICLSLTAVCRSSV